MSFGKISVQRDVIRGTICRGNVRSGNFPFEELTFGELSAREISVGELSQNRIDLSVEFLIMLNNDQVGCTAQKMKFSIKDFLSKFDQICSIWLHLLEKSLMENFMFCAVLGVYSPCAQTSSHFRST